MEPKTNLKLEQPGFISTWTTATSPVIAIGVLNAFYLALILEKLSGKDLTPDLRKKIGNQVFDSLMNLTIDFHQILNAAQPTPEAFYKTLLQSLKMSE